MPLRILLADDSLTAQNLGKKILTDAGYEVIAVSNGAQAMKKIVGERPDLVVLDVYMPGYTGLEVCERIRNSRETASIPVLLSVGKMEAFKPEEATRVHAEGLIVKPFEATELVATIKKMAESLAPVVVAKHPPKPVAPEAEPPEEIAAPEDGKLEIETFGVQIPREIASSPAFGIDLIPAELQEPEAPAPSQPANGLIEFEVERDAAPVTVDPGVRMTSAAGLSGVFEVSPSAVEAVETPVEQAPVEQFERFTPEASTPSFEGVNSAEPADEVPGGEPQAFAGEQQIEAVAPTSEWQSWPAAEPASSEFHVEHFGAGPETAAPASDFQAPQNLPELTSWEEPSSLASAASAGEWSIPQFETSFTPEASQPASDAQTEQASVGSVWVAEETEIEPQESAVSLHEQMQQALSASEGNEPEPVASLVETAATEPEEVPIQSWEAPEPQPEPQIEEAEQHAAEPQVVERAYSAPEQESIVAPAPVAEAHADLSEFAHWQQEERTPETAEPYDQLPEAPAELPKIIEAPVDPLRIARIVDQLIERLKPELIAAVTRELEHKDS